MKNSKFSFAAFLIAAALTVTPFATAGSAAAKDKKATLSVQSLFKRYAIQPEAVGYVLIDPSTGYILEAHNADEAFIPASSIKIQAALAGLAILGENYRYETRMYMTGTVEGGTLKGNLYLLGGGDPSLTTDHLEPFVERLKQMGISRVSGKLVYDDHLIPTHESIDSDHFNEVAYNPSVGALSLNFNRLKLKWQRGLGKNREDLTVHAVARTDRGEIPVKYLSFGWIETNISAPHGLAYDPNGGKPKWLFMKRVRPKGEIWVPVKRPGFYSAHVFRNLAAKQGLALPQGEEGRLPRGARLVGSVKSKPLATVIRRMMYYSNNMMAEMIGMTSAVKLTSAGLPIGDSALALSEWVKARAQGAAWLGYRVMNHSGLSTKTRVTPNQLAAILRYAGRQKFGEVHFQDVLKAYNISSRRDPLPKHVAVRAKTGTINYSRAVAGYLTTRGKRDLIFAVFVSDFRVREVRAAAKEKYKIPRRGGWMARSRNLQRAIVRRFAEKY